MTGSQYYQHDVRIAVVATLLVGCGRIGFDQGGVVIDSTGVAAISANATTSLSLTTLDVGNGPDECLIAALVLRNPSATAIALRWNGTVMTPVTSAPLPGGAGVAFSYRLVAPDAGLQSLTADWTGESDAVLGAISVSGADQVDCVRAVATGQGSSDTTSVTIPSAPGHLTIDVSATTSTFGAATRSARWTATADGAPRVVQQTSHFTTALSDTCTLPVAPAAGHQLLFVGGGSFGTLSPITGAGVSWQRAVVATTNSNVEIWYGVSNGSDRTVTYSSSAANSMRCWVGELTGLDTTQLDGTIGTSGPASPAFTGDLVTAGSHDYLVAAFSTFNAGSWGVPTQGPWTSLGEVTGAGASQITFSQTVVRPGTWNPSIATGSTDPRWDAVAAAFTAGSPGISGALSTADGGSSTAHAWSLGSASAWTSIGLDVSP